MHADFAWLTEHSQELYEKYAGKWIAVLNGEIIGVGDIATEAIDQAESKHPDADYVLESVDANLERI